MAVPARAECLGKSRSESLSDDVIFSATMTSTRFNRFSWLDSSNLRIAELQRQLRVGWHMAPGGGKIRLARQGAAVSAGRTVSP